MAPGAGFVGPGFGGGIDNGGVLSIINSTISGNSSTEGGGSCNGGVLSIINSTISGNSSGVGGGIESLGGAEHH